MSEIIGMQAMSPESEIAQLRASMLGAGKNAERLEAEISDLRTKLVEAAMIADAMRMELEKVTKERDELRALVEKANWRTGYAVLFRETGRISSIQLNVVTDDTVHRSKRVESIVWQLATEARKC